MEPLVTAVISTINSRIPTVHITAHFSRFRVTQISLDAASTAQFEVEPILLSASLLKDAGVDAIAYGGTSGGWLGLDVDNKLCNAIVDKVDIPTRSSTSSLIHFLGLHQVSKLGLVTPYSKDMNEAIARNFATKNISVVETEPCLAIVNNRRIADVTEAQLADILERVLKIDTDVKFVTTYCTNLKSAQLAVAWEQQYKTKDLTVLDSITVVLWELLETLGIKTQGTGVAQIWGRIFDS